MLSKNQRAEIDGAEMNETATLSTGVNGCAKRECGEAKAGRKSGNALLCIIKSRDSVLECEVHPF